MSDQIVPFPHLHELAVDGEPIQEVGSLSVLDGKKYVRNREGDFTDSRLKSKLASGAMNHLFLLPPEVSGIAEPTGGVDIHLTEIPGLELGRKNRRSVVKFGQLYIDDGSSTPITELVAVKYVHPIPAIRETYASMAVNRRFGRRLTYDPLGFIKHPDGKVGYVTRYEHAVETLDNILWNPQSTPQQRDQAMARAGLWMAQLHNHGIRHGDAQAKNIALDSTQSPRYMDLEGAEVMRYGALERQLDISDLFDPESMKRDVSGDEIMHFTDAYFQAQETTQPTVEVEDIVDTIAEIQKKHKKVKRSKLAS